MRIFRLVLLLGGLALLVVVFLRVGPGAVLASLGQLAWWQLALVCLPFGLIMAVDTLGWRFAFARDRAPFHVLVGARVAGEALNVLTALGQVGGEAVKAWLVRRDVPYEESVPSVVIAKTTITMAQGLFLLIAIVLAWATLDVDARILRGMLWLLVAEVLAVGGFFLTQVAGLVARTGRLLAWAGIMNDASHAEQLDQALRQYYRYQWRRFLLSVGFHLLGWLLGGLEAFFVLFVLGVPVSVGRATVIEALGSGVRFATFLVPAGLGPYEGANAGVFAALGFGAGAGLAFSLVRRARQGVWIGVGLITLVVMRSMESLADARRSAV